MRASYFQCLILCSIVFLSCNKTSTPAEFLYIPSVSKDVYKNDALILRNIFIERFDSINRDRDSKSDREYVDAVIDTIFYGPSDKVAFLIISTAQDPLIGELGGINQGGFVYVGECYVGIKSNAIFENLRPLKYSVSSSEDFERVAKSLREIYFRELYYIPKNYNLNDLRFWQSSVW